MMRMLCSVLSCAVMSLKLLGLAGYNPESAVQLMVHPIFALKNINIYIMERKTPTKQVAIFDSSFYFFQSKNRI